LNNAIELLRLKQSLWERYSIVFGRLAKPLSHTFSSNKFNTHFGVSIYELYPGAYEARILQNGDVPRSDADVYDSINQH